LGHLGGAHSRVPPMDPPLHPSTPIRRHLKTVNNRSLWSSAGSDAKGAVGAQHPKIQLRRQKADKNHNSRFHRYTISQLGQGECEFFFLRRMN